MRFFKGVAIACAIAIAAPAAMSLAACGTTGQASGHLVAAKSLYIAELAYNAEASSIVAAAHSGALSGDKLQQAKAVDAQAYAALQTARAGKGSADAVIEALKAGDGLVPLPTAAPPN